MNVMQALEIMKTHVVTVNCDSTLADAVDRMDLYQVDELPVVDGSGFLRGMIQESEIALAVAEHAFQAGEHSAPDAKSAAAVSALLVQDTMSAAIMAVRDTDEVTPNLVRTMLTSVRRIPVIDNENRIVGTLNRVDIIQALFERTITLR